MLVADICSYPFSAPWSRSLMSNLHRIPSISLRHLSLEALVRRKEQHGLRHVDVASGPAGAQLVGVLYCSRKDAVLDLYGMRPSLVQGILKN
jgi:hypothetical protein